MKVMTAIITPFNIDYQIDYQALKELLNRLIKEGCKGFVVCGTTGESSTLSSEEKVQLLSFVLKHVHDDCEVWYGCGSNDTYKTLQQMKAVEHLCFRGYLLVCPYYNKPNEEGLYRHYAYLAKHSKYDIMLYHVPHRCGISLTYTLIKRLIKDCPKINALKHADSDFTLVHQLKTTFPHFTIYSGEDSFMIESIEAKCDGFISVLSHICYQEMMECIQTKKENILLKKQAELLFSDASPNVIKYLLSLRNECHNILRLPLCELQNKDIIKSCHTLFRHQLYN